MVIRGSWRHNSKGAKQGQARGRPAQCPDDRRPGAAGLRASVRAPCRGSRARRWVSGDRDRSHAPSWSSCSPGASQRLASIACRSAFAWSARPGLPLESLFKVSGGSQECHGHSQQLQSLPCAVAGRECAHQYLPAYVSIPSRITYLMNSCLGTSVSTSQPRSVTRTVSLIAVPYRPMSRKDVLQWKTIPGCSVRLLDSVISTLGQSLHIGGKVSPTEYP